MLKNNVEQYIKDQCKENGSLKEPLRSIAKKSGVSIATAHRALRDLENQYAVKVIPAKHRTKPNTILYVGKSDEATSMDNLGDEFKHSVFKELVGHLAHKQNLIEQLRSEVSKLQGCVVKTVEIPETEYEITIKRRDKYEPGAMEGSRSEIHSSSRSNNDTRVADRGTS